MYVLFCTFRFHPANWHPSVNLTEITPRFSLSYKVNARIYLAKTRHGQHSSQINCIVLCVVLCVTVYCTAATGCQPNSS
jgi:hypothetical protein